MAILAKEFSAKHYVLQEINLSVFVEIFLTSTKPSILASQILRNNLLCSTSLHQMRSYDPNQSGSGSLLLGVVRYTIVVTALVSTTLFDICFAPYLGKANPAFFFELARMFINMIRQTLCAKIRSRRQAAREFAMFLRVATGRALCHTQKKIVSCTGDMV